MKKNNKKMNVLIFTSYVYGGAGCATAGMHDSLLINGINSKLVTRETASNRMYEGKNYIFLNPDIGLNYDEIQLEKNKKEDNTIFSLNEPKLNRKTLDKLVKDVDVIVLQWVARFLTAEDIGYLTNLGIPVVMIIRDMNLLAGGCHYFHGCKNWLKNCESCPQLLNDKAGNFPKKVFDIKKEYWNTDNITIFLLSEHTKKIVEKSPILSKCSIKVIGNSIDLDIFKPSKDGSFKKNLNLRCDIPTVFHLPSHGSNVKGFNEFLDSLNIIKKKHPDFKLQLLVAGSGSSRMIKIGCPYPIINVGVINDKKELAKLYSQSNITVIPSLAETFSNTAAESVACGTPIVGFDTGAIKEIVGDDLRGRCVELGNVNDFADAVYEVLNSNISGKDCVEYAKQNFSRKRQGKKYADLLKELVESNEKLDISLLKNKVPFIDENCFPNLLNFLSQSSNVQKSPCVKNPQRKEIVELKKTLQPLNVQKDPCTKNSQRKEIVELKKTLQPSNVQKALCAKNFQRQEIVELKKTLQKKVSIIENQDFIIFDLQNSKSFRLGELVFRSIKKPYKLLTFPINFLRILINK